MTPRSLRSSVVSATECLRRSRSREKRLPTEPSCVLLAAVILACVAGAVSEVGAIATAEQVPGEGRISGLAPGGNLGHRYLRRPYPPCCLGPDRTNRLDNGRGRNDCRGSRLDLHTGPSPLQPRAEGPNVLDLVLLTVQTPLVLWRHLLPAAAAPRAITPLALGGKAESSLSKSHEPRAPPESVESGALAGPRRG